MTNLDADTTPASERVWQATPHLPTSALEAIDGADNDAADARIVRAYHRFIDAIAARRNGGHA